MHTGLPLSSEGWSDCQEGVGAGLACEEKETASQEVSGTGRGGWVCIESQYLSPLHCGSCI